MSLIGALTPLGKVATRRSTWLRNIALYTVAGAVSSAAVGAALGALGAMFLAPGLDPPRLALVAIVALAAIAHELGWITLPQPQIRRQTSRAWALGPAPVAMILWGLDLGLLFTTWVTFAGVWAVVAASILAASPLLGAGLLTAYWAGRVLSAWIGPALLPTASATPQLVSAIHRQHELLRRVHIAGLIWLVLTLSLIFATGTQ
jgi:hypothetical protein